MTDKAQGTLLTEKIEQLYHDLAATGDIRRFAMEMVALAGDRTYADAPDDVCNALARIVPATVMSPLIEVACPKCGSEEFDVVNHCDDDGLSYREQHECSECSTYYWVWWYATQITSEESVDSQDDDKEHDDVEQG